MWQARSSAWTTPAQGGNRCPHDVSRGHRATAPSRRHRPCLVVARMSSTTSLPQQQSWASGWEQSSAQNSSQGQGLAVEERPRQGGSWQPRDDSRFSRQGGGRQEFSSGRPRDSQGQSQGRRTSHTPAPDVHKQPYKMVLKRQGKLPNNMAQQDLQVPTGLAITWLGTSSGTPTLERNVSCTVVRTPDSIVLVDCGEGSHRQLPAMGFDLNQVFNIYVTHLHGDHCYGLGTTLLAIDRAKAAAAATVQAEAGSSQGVSTTSIYLWGPVGLAELLHAQLVITGAHRNLFMDIVVTELVVDDADAITEPQPLVEGCTKIQMARHAPRHVAQSPRLMAAVESVRRPLSVIPPVWTARPGMGARRTPGQLKDKAYIGNEDMSDEEAENLYGGRNFVAAEGLVWDLQLPGRSGPGLRVLAAQLQHRVPCWGYVFQEATPFLSGAKRRKAVILGDTVNSSAIAPIALGCDVLSHEATFIEGMEDKCRIAQHSTAWMAGAFAHAVQAQLLVLTHFSARYHRTGEPIRPRGRGGVVMREREISAEEEVQEQALAVHRLVEEAQAQHPAGRVVAASDFFTLNVPLQLE